MKKSQIKKILKRSSSQQQKLSAMICVTIITAFLAISMFIGFSNTPKSQYVKYKENSNVDYQVFLKENQFFENNYLIAENSYITSLIDNIEAKFQYDLYLEQGKIDYKYTYWIEAEVLVNDKKHDKPLYQSTEIVQDKITTIGTNDHINITKNVSIDYDRYNELIKNFIQVYGLDNTTSVLNINLYVDVINICERSVEGKTHQRKTTLTIPLTTKTTAIDISNNLIENKNDLIKCNTMSTKNSFLIFGTLFGIASILMGIVTFRYSRYSRSLENKYERKLKRLLSHYGSFIQQIENEFDFTEYQVVKINTFEDMLEIRDTIKQPILMKEKEDRTGAYFLIPSATKILYVYRIKVGDNLK